jgi:uncharacterized protein YndB with AHSA1/START domain
MPRRIRVEVTRTLDRPVDVVFGALTDERESPHWRGVSAADYDVGGRCVVGAKFWRSAGRQREAFEVTSCEPHSVYAVSAVERDHVEAISCRPLDALTTEVDWVLEQSVTSYPWPLDRLVGWAQRRQLERQLDAAAAWLAPSDGASSSV